MSEKSSPLFIFPLYKVASFPEDCHHIERVCLMDVGWGYSVAPSLSLPSTVSTRGLAFPSTRVPPFDGCLSGFPPSGHCDVFLHFLIPLRLCCVWTRLWEPLCCSAGTRRVFGNRKVAGWLKSNSRNYGNQIEKILKLGHAKITVSLLIEMN